LYIGYRGSKIEVVSKTLLYNSTTTFVRLDNDLANIDPEILKADYEVVDGKVARRGTSAAMLNKIAAQGTSKSRPSTSPATTALGQRVVTQQEKTNQKVAIISSYGTNCGMSTYCKMLVEEMSKLVGNICIFAEQADDIPPEENIVRCWDRTKGDYSKILGAIKEYNPDIIYVQHEYGSFHNPVSWNMLIGYLSSRYKTVVILHSVYEHVDKLVFESPCQEIIVHSETARDLLRQKGITHAPIHYIPHGCMQQTETEIKHSTFHNQNMLFQFGFGFEYKGWSTVPDVVDALIKDYPEVAYIGIFNMSKFYMSFHEEYYKKLMEQLEERSLYSNVVLHKGFRSEQVLFSYMKQAKINLFPYWNHPDWRVHGASGAVRLALASGTPTIVGDVPFFHEFKGYIPVCRSIEEYVTTIKKIFEEPTYAQEVRDNQHTFITERSWDKVARWYLEAPQNSSDWSAPINRRQR